MASVCYGKSVRHECRHASRVSCSFSRPTSATPRSPPLPSLFIFPLFFTILLPFLPPAPPSVRPPITPLFLPFLLTLDRRKATTATVALAAARDPAALAVYRALPPAGVSGLLRPICQGAAEGVGVVATLAAAAAVLLLVTGNPAAVADYNRGVVLLFFLLESCDSCT